MVFFLMVINVVAGCGGSGSNGVSTSSGSSNNTASGPTALVSGLNDPLGIAVDGTSVYWVHLSGGTVMKVPVIGGTPAMLASGQSSPNLIAVDANSVYWTNSNDGTLVKSPK